MTVVLSAKEDESVSFEPLPQNDSFSVGDTVELSYNGLWLTCEVEKTNHSEYTLTSIWNNESYIILKGEISRIRKPKKVKTEERRGLKNLGNSCYMNAILQCISHTPLMWEYFSNEAFIKDLNRNSKTTNGTVSSELGKLIHALHQKKNIPHSPSSFKEAFLQLYPDFIGDHQQDSHEFLIILFGLLHKELNREMNQSIKCYDTVTLDDPDEAEEKKQSKEQWRQIQGSDGSVLTDFFCGQTRRALQCENCGKRQIIFERFMDLSLPIPILQGNKFKITFIPNVSGSHKVFKHKEFKLQLNEKTVVENILSVITKNTRVSPKNLLFCSIYSHEIVQLITDICEIADILPKGDQEVYVYEVLHTIDEGESEGRPTLKPANDPNWDSNLEKSSVIDISFENQWYIGTVDERNGDNIAVWVHTDKKQKTNTQIHSDTIAPFRKYTKNDDEILYIPLYMRKEGNVSFGTPLVASIGNWFTLNDLYKRIEDLCKRYVSRSKAEQISSLIRVYLKSGAVCAICDIDSCSGCEMPKESYKLLSFFSQMSVIVDWIDPSHYCVSFPEKIEEQDSFNLYQCLDEYTKREIVSSRCKHCGNTNCSLRSEIWRLPDILILHLKRFYYSNGSFKKIQHLVEFPRNDLDLSNWMISQGSKPRLIVMDNPDNSRYELFGMVNHLGSSVGGHYTAYCQDDKELLEFNDESVFRITDETEIISPQAYILFYKRKRFLSSNIVNLGLSK